MSDADIRLATIRAICRREGHGPLVDITSGGEMPLSRLLCNRGCHAEIRELDTRWPFTEAQMREFLDRNAGKPMRITRFEVEIAAGEA